jgi:histidyl-tRNA synthetase
LLRELRASNIPADMDLSGRSVKNQFKVADREKARWTITVGEDELSSNSFNLKNLGTGEQTKVARDELIAKLKASV